MKSRIFREGAVFLLISLLIFGCSTSASNEPQGNGNDQPVPLDGRGGGVIAYCFQPLPGASLHQIYGINADGSGNQKLIESSIGLNHHDWSPDASRLAAVGYVTDATWSIYTFNTDGTNLIRLTSAENVNDTDPHWSPDGTQLVFTRIYPEENERFEIWIMNADGSDQHSIGVEGFAAKWSVDGSHFIYQSSFRSENSDIMTCSIDGSDQLKLTSTQFREQAPVYSPDGDQIAFISNRDGNFEIYVMDSDGSDPVRLTNSTDEDYSPRWSPDGSRIAFGSGPFGEWEVFIIDSNGSNEIQLTDSPPSITAINPVWRPQLN